MSVICSLKCTQRSEMNFVKHPISLIFLILSISFYLLKMFFFYLQYKENRHTHSTKCSVLAWWMQWPSNLWIFRRPLCRRYIMTPCLWLTSNNNMYGSCTGAYTEFYQGGGGGIFRNKTFSGIRKKKFRKLGTWYNFCSKFLRSVPIFVSSFVSNF